MNKQLNIVHTDKGITKRPIEKHIHHDEEDHHDDHHHDKHEEDHEPKVTKDPHIWLDPILVIQQAQHIAGALCDIDPEGCKFYNENLSKFTSDTLDLDKKIRQIVSKEGGNRHFMVFHPSWGGYFADRYGFFFRYLLSWKGKSLNRPTLKSLSSLHES